MASTILTLALDEAAQAHFDALRRRWYPPALNRIPAHLTLFHTLPPTQAIERVLADAAFQTAIFPIQVVGLFSLGRGVAYRMQSDAALQLHRSLSAAFADELTPQDRQSFRPHIVVQNKVTPAEARELLHTLEDDFAPSTVTAVGLAWWDYLGGPWALRRHFAFHPAP